MDNGNFSSFGALLKSFRKRHHFTQQQLADAIGVHRNAIGRWEQGHFLPENKGIVLELAKHLKLDTQEARQLLEASFTALAPLWGVPLTRNPLFTGRQDILADLHAYLSAGQKSSLIRSYALRGLGGIGKTQLALEYAYRHALEYSAVFWIGAETPESIITGLLYIAELLQLPERLEADQQRTVIAVQRWLAMQRQWLLICDNVEDLELLHRWLPHTLQGAILITTRLQALGSLAQGVEVTPMGQEEGILFVLRRAKVLELTTSSQQMQKLVASRPNEYAIASELVRAMGGVPLALDQAGAYVEETGCSLEDYLERYRHQRTRLLSRRGVVTGNHPHSVTTTFLLARQQVEREQGMAAEILRICAFLQADAIPEELFTRGTAHLGPAFEPLTVDLSHFDLAVAVLRRLSLIQRHTQTRTLSIHPLVQTVLREQMSEKEQMECIKLVIEALNAIFPEVTPEVWKQCELLLPHVLTCATAIPDAVGKQVLAKVLRKAADYLYERAQYEQAEPLYQRALRLEEQALELDAHNVANTLSGLARLYLRQGKYRQAEFLFQRALSIQEQALGSEHPDLAYPLNGLAFLYWTEGKYELAEPLFKRSLSIQEQTQGPEHPDLTYPLNGLAFLYWNEGKYELVEPLLKRALSIREQALGPDHPRITDSLIGLADLYLKQDKDAQAEKFYQRAIRIRELAWGPEHPYLAQPLTGLANLYLKQSKYEQAEELYQRAVHIREQALGPDHPRVSDSLTGLADLYLKLGKNEQAEALYQRILRIREQTLGESHSDTTQTLHNLSILYQRQGKLDEAIYFAQRALTICIQTLGEFHPQTVGIRTHHAQLLKKRAEVGCDIGDPKTS